MYNKVVLAGNLTRDIELKYSQSGSAIANTAIATSRKFTVNGEKKEETCFIDITFFGRSGDVANQYLQKGSKILVEGRLNFEQWADKETGAKRSKHSVIVETMQMLDTKPKNEYAQQEQSGYGDDGYKPNQNAPAYYGDGTPNPSYDPNPKTAYTPPMPTYEKHTDYRVPPPVAMPANTTPSLMDDMDEIPF